MTESIKLVRLSKIRWNSEERKKAEKSPVVEVLMQSIRENELIEPIVLKPDMSFVVGRKRAIAFERLERKSIPAIIRGGDKKAEIAENLHREHLSKEERDALLAEYVALLAGKGWGKPTATKKAAIEKVAKEAGVSPKTVERAIAEPKEKAEKPPEPGLPKGFNAFGLELTPLEVTYVLHSVGRYQAMIGALSDCIDDLSELAGQGLIEPAKAQRLQRELQGVLNDLKSAMPIALCPSCKMLEGVKEACGSCFGSGLAGKAALAGIDKALLLTGEQAIYVDAEGAKRKVKS